MNPVDQRYEFYPAGPEWTTEPALIAGRRCRQPGCERPAVCALNRSRNRSQGGERWYAYCDKPNHMYGRRFDPENNIVLDYRLRLGDD